MKLNTGSFAKRALMVALLAGGGMLATASMATNTGAPANNCEARQGQKVMKESAKWREQRAAHLAELKAQLKLKPEQEAAWQAFSSGVESGVRGRNMDRQAMRDEFAKLNTPQRLDQMLAKSEARRGKMLQRVETTKAFYAELTPEQQSVFDSRTRMKRQHGHKRQRMHS
jgi:periplasmic protein CpxP/Spy